MPENRRTRRSLLTALGAGAAVGASGCLANPLAGQDWGSGGLEDPDEPARGYTPFFGLWDVANRVGGDAFQFENPVDTGAMGHGWSPDGNIVPRIASTDAFVYLDTPEFAWAQDAAQTLRNDFGDFPVIDAMESVQSHLLFDTEPMPTPDEGEFPLETIRFDEWDIYDLRDTTQLGYWHVDHWHGGVPDVAVGDFVPIGFVLYGEQEQVVPLGGDYEFDARVAAGDADAVTIESTGETVRFHGESTGEAGIVFEIYHEGELVYDTAAAPTFIEVVEEYDDDPDETGFHDPHIWVDPVLMGMVTESIADELSAIDPDHAETYAANAAALVDAFEAVDEEFRTMVADAELDVAVFAGHDSYQYVENRYDFRLETPVGVSPDAMASTDDIAGLLETIETAGIDTVLFDPFEAPTAGDEPQMVQTIMENSAVDNAEPLTPLEATTDVWEANDWGWIEQMREINIPSLERALNPE